jgi:hypothetical protein
VGLLNVGDILLMHGTEESFKSVLTVQIAESIASASTLLCSWKVPKARRVGVIETELHEVMLGERLGKMFPEGKSPENLSFLVDTALRQWRKQKMLDKFKLIQDWIDERGIQVLVIDTANDFFRGSDDPDDERAVGGFFDHLRNLTVESRLIVRHDRKESVEDSRIANTNERIRGSAEWKEDPEVIVHIQRKDRRTHEVTLEVGKLRYGRKPEPFSLFFDAGSFRLTPLPPVIAILESGPCSRQELLALCRDRFSLGERKADELLNEQRQFLTEDQRGHEKVFALNQECFHEAPWSSYFGE